tara:strand:+ start:35 stop:553 length:519 start_codon:yes stop_codon:yes gene_type:complete
MWLTVLVIAGVAGTTAGATKGNVPATIGSALASGAAVQTIRHPRLTYNFAKPIIRPVARGAWAIGRDVIFRPALAAGRSFAASPTAAIAAAAAAGYVLGSTGTVVASGVLEKKGYVRAGTTDSLIDFYTFGITESGGTPARDRSKWYESDIPILNIPGDVAYIGKHYWNKAF